LYSKTKPGFYLEIHPDLHLAYAHQKNGHNTPHYWRLFFTERWKTHIEKVANSSALFVPPADTNYEEYFQAQPDKDYFLQWSGIYFRSKTEIKIVKELYNRDVLFFANTRGQVSCQSSPASEKSGQLPSRIEVNFLDAGWGELTRQLAYKSLGYGRTFVQLDRWFPGSKRCS
jgi:hypothetical protein